ncbi:radical SAM protein, partial [Citrobacter sp. AAK_AS5]
MANPEPVHAFIDLFLLGDVEAVIPSFMDTYVENRGEKRAEIIDRLSLAGWAYNPLGLEVSY